MTTIVNINESDDEDDWLDKEKNDQHFQYEVQ
ncbi:MAG: hypothetical protein ACJAUP_000633 [Cellvibrionaceae bacterium]|jgi:hypothetical protein